VFPPSGRGLVHAPEATRGSRLAAAFSRKARLRAGLTRQMAPSYKALCP
jgi:hypothetical protein